MGKFSLAMVVCGAAGVVAGTVASGVAAADSLTGATYADAADAINSWGGTPVVSTVIGERADRDDCVVTSWRQDTNDKAKYLLALNCNEAVAEPGHSGNSVASPEGRYAKQKKDAIQWRSENPEWCAQALEQHPEWGELEGCTYGGGEE